MFGREKIQMLEGQLRDLQDRLDQVTREKEEAAREKEQTAREKSGLEEQLSESLEKVSQLEVELHDAELEALNEGLRSRQEEYDGLQKRYSGKLKEFTDYREEKEQEFAKTAAVSRYLLDGEIRKNREDKQEFVSNTVKDFTDSFNYYLNQIKVLMEALGTVASGAGATLFLREGDDLKAQIGQEVAENLKTEVEDLQNEDGVVLIGYAGEENCIF